MSDDDRRDDDDPRTPAPGESPSPEAGPEDKRAIDRTGVPSFFPSDAELGALDDLDALAPDARGEATGEHETHRVDAQEISGVVPMPSGAVDRDESGELVLPSAPAPMRASERPGLLSSVLVQERAPVDEGALAALRNLPRRARGLRRPFPPSGAPGADGTRADFLLGLAELVQGATRARLCCAAAEVYAGAGMPQRAESLYQAAHEADPADVVALAALQRAALAANDTERLVTLLRQETALPLAPRERALVWTRLALVALARGEHGTADEAIDAARRDAPEACAPALLRACLSLRAGRMGDAAAALAAVARAWPSASGRAAFWTQCARAFAADGESARAREAATSALGADASSADACLCAYRLARAARVVPDALDALTRLERCLEGAEMRAEVVRTRARLAHGLARDPRKALALLEGGSTPADLRARARAAEALADDGLLVRALEAWADGVSGSERALVQVELAFLHARAGASERAEAALDAAAAADGELTLVRVARERIARAAGDARSIARSIAPGRNLDSVDAAARLAARRNAVSEERELLAAAREAGGGTTVDVVAIDAAAEASAWTAAADGLRRDAARLAGEARAGAYLALASLERRAPGGAGDAAISTEAARVAAPTAPHVLAEQRAGARSPDALATLWLETAHATTGPRAASAALLASVAATSTDAERDAALARALEADPRYLPALWNRARRVRRSTTRAGLDALDQAIAEASTDPTERAARWTRVALARATTDVGAALRAAEHAFAAHPADVTTDLLVLALSNPSLERRAEHLERAAASAPAPLARALHLQAAACHEDAGAYGRAAALYHGALDASDGTDPHARLGIERSLPRTGLHALLSQREAALLGAEDEATRVHALDRLARRQDAAGDVAHARGAWTDLLALRPDHRGALRGLERLAMQAHDDDALLGCAKRLLVVLAARADRRGYLTLACHLTRAAGAGGPDACDALVVQAVGREPDLWLALQLEGAALRAGDAALAIEAERALAARLHDPIERASVALRIADGLEDRSRAEALAALREVADVAHPVASEELARLAGLSGDHAAAAEGYERAARVAATTERKARLLHRAACLWQDQLSDGGRALAALRQVLTLKGDHPDAYARARRLLEANDDAAGLVELLERRLAAPVDRDTAIALESERAALYARIGDPRRGREALARALELAPERIDLTERLAALYVASGQHHEAAELLVRLARTSQDPALLHRTFRALGTIYDEHLPDPRRAEIALTRAAALAPDDVRALERLASVLHKNGELQRALRVLVRLYEVAEHDLAAAERCILRIAELSDALGEPKDAERALEAHRRRHPTRAAVIVALADRYRTQGDASALAVHLDRSIVSLRAEIERDPGRAEAWQTLAEVLRRRERGEAARAVERLGNAIGVPGLPARDTIEGLGADAFAPGVVSRSMPRALDSVACSLVRALDDVVDAVAPPPPGTLDGGLYDAPPAALGEAFGRVAAWLGRGTQLHRSTGTRVFALADEPLVLAVGPDLAEHASTDELVFLLMQAAALARLDLSIAVRRDPGELEHTLRAFAAGLDPEGPHGELPEALRELGARLAAALEPGVRLPLRERAHALATVGIDVGTFGRLAREAGARVALAATGDPAAALTALQLAGDPDLFVSEPLEAARDAPDARSLLADVLADACAIGTRGSAS